MKQLAAAAGLLLACAISPALANKPQPDAAPPQTQAEAFPHIGLLLERVEKLAEEGRADEALALADEALAKAPLPGMERGMVQLMRGGALVVLERFPEAIEALDQAAAMTDLSIAYMMLAEAQVIGDQALEASQTLMAATYRDPEILMDFELAVMAELLERLRDQGHLEARFELTLTLARAGYDGGEPAGRLDWLKTEAAGGLLERGRLEEAVPLIDAVTDSYAMLNMLVSRRFEPLWPTLEEKAGLDMARQLANALASVEEARRQAPDNLKLLYRNMNTLLALGRYDEAIALGEPLSRDMAAVAEHGYDAFWVVNEQAFALASTGRGEEADQLMETLLALGMDEHPDLVSLAINRAENLLLLLGRYEDALRAADWAEEKGSFFMSDSGRMWVLRHRVCALAALGQHIHAWLALGQMIEMRQKNGIAYLDALLCTDQLDEAEEVIAENLDSLLDRDAMLAILQNYTGQRHTPFGDMIKARLDSLISRPEVAKAVNAAGRIITVAGTGDW